MFSLVFIAPLLAPAASAWTTVPEKWTLWAAGNSLISSHPTTATQPSTALAALICITYVFAILGSAIAIINHHDA